MLKSCIAKDMGYEFHEAGDGLEGLNRYKELAPDVTFMDLTMPVMDGATSLREILAFDKDALVIVDLLAQGQFVSFPFLKPAYADLRYLATARERLSLRRRAVISQVRSASSQRASSSATCRSSSSSRMASRSAKNRYSDG